MSAMNVLDRASELGMLEPKVIADLRRQVSESKWSITPEALVKLLVDRGHLTAFQARKLVTDALEVAAKPADELAIAEPPAAKAPAVKPGAKAPVAAPVEEDDEEIVDLEAALPPPPSTSAPTKKPGPAVRPINEDLLVTPSSVSEGPELTVAPLEAPAAKTTTAESAGAKPKASTKPASAKPAKPAPLKPISPLTPLAPAPSTAPSSAPPAFVPKAPPVAGLTPLPAPGPMPPGLSPVVPTVPGLTPMAPSGLTPLGSPGLTPLGAPGLTPLGAPGLAPLGAPPGLTPLGAPGPVAGVPGLDLVADSLTPLGSAPVPGLAPMGMSPTGMMAGFTPGPVAVEAPTTPGLESYGQVVEPPKRKKKKVIDKRFAPKWDSPWLLGGAGLLAVTALICVLLLYSLGNTSAEKLFELANNAYKSGQYSQAIASYDQFARGYPSDSKASLCRVKSGMAKIRQVYDNQKSMERALEAAKENLPLIENEAAFSEARPELVDMLPTIASNFAVRAKAEKRLAAQESLVGLADEALTFVDNPAYITQADRANHASRIEQVKETLAVARREIEQTKTLNTALEVMEKAIADKRTGDAYAARADFLNRYPGQKENVLLVEAARKVAKAERDLIVPIEKPRASIAVEPTRPGDSTLLASRNGAAVDALKGRIVAVMANGAAYGVDIGDAKVLWSRPTGASTRLQPVYAGPIASSDVIVANQEEGYIERVDRVKGNVKWRYPIDEAFLQPVVQENERVFVAVESGAIHEINLDDGKSDRRCSLPQGVTSAPAFDPKRKVLYQAGASGSLFAIAADALGGRDSVYLDHKQGSVLTPPLVVSGHVVVCENNRRNKVTVHFFNTKRNGLGLEKVDKTLELTGQMLVPAAAYGRRVVILTSTGEVAVVEIDVNSEDNPIENAVRVVAVQPGSGASTVVGYQLLDGPRLWVADTRLAKYEIIASQSALARGPTIWDGDAFVAPMQRIEGHVVTVRKRSGAAAATVQLLATESDDAFWSIDLAAAPMWMGEGPNQQAQIIDASGARHLVSLTGDMLSVSDEPDWRAESAGAALRLSQRISLGSGCALLDTTRGLVVTSRVGEDSPSVASLRLEGGALAGPIAAFQGGLLAPTSNGRISLIDPDRGEPRSGVLPFFPDLAPGAAVSWLRPVVYGVEGRRFVTADNRRQLFLVGYGERPQKSLLETARIADGPYVGSMAIVGDRLFTTIRESDSDLAAVYSMPGLTELSRERLFGRLGARAVSASGELALYEIDRGALKELKKAEDNSVDAKASDKKSAGKKADVTKSVEPTIEAPPMISRYELMAYDKNGAQLWRAPLLDGPLSADPATLGEVVVLAHQKGVVATLDAKTGARTGALAIGEALVDSLWTPGESVYVGSRSGKIHRVALPLPAPQGG